MTDQQHTEQTSGDNGECAIDLGLGGLVELIREAVTAEIEERIAQHEQAVRKAVHEEIAALLDVEDAAVSSVFEAINQRLGEIEKSCGLLVDHATFMEKALVRVTEAAQRMNGQEPEQWRESLDDDDRGGE